MPPTFLLCFVPMLNHRLPKPLVFGSRSSACFVPMLNHRLPKPSNNIDFGEWTNGPHLSAAKSAGQVKLLKFHFFHHIKYITICIHFSSVSCFGILIFIFCRTQIHTLIMSLLIRQVIKHLINFKSNRLFLD